MIPATHSPSSSSPSRSSHKRLQDDNVHLKKDEAVPTLKFLRDQKLLKEVEITVNVCKKDPNKLLIEGIDQSTKMIEVPWCFMESKESPESIKKDSNFQIWFSSMKGIIPKMLRGHNFSSGLRDEIGFSSSEILSTYERIFEELLIVNEYKVSQDGIQSDMFLGQDYDVWTTKNQELSSSNLLQTV